jgi:uncharacterized protein YqkB
MAVLGRLLVQNKQRLDLSDLKSIESYSAGDWKYYFKTVAGDTPYILQGFDIINPGDAINKTVVTIKVEDSIVYSPSSEASPFFFGLPISSGLSDPIEPTLKRNATNYLYLTLNTEQGVPDIRAFWDQSLNNGDGGDFKAQVNTEEYIVAEVGVSTVDFPENSIPLAKVRMDATVIKSIQDCRQMFFRLGTGGFTPNPLNNYFWRSLPTAGYKRVETNDTMTDPLDPNPFQGADKNIRSWKEWMDAIMSKIKEMDGNAHWYDQSVGSIHTIFDDVLKSTFRSKGKWEHDTSTPGLLKWNEDIHVSYFGSKLDLIIKSKSSGETLNNNQLLYIDLEREQDVNSASIRLNWTNGATYIDSEAIGGFANVKIGDYIKKKGEANNNFVRIIQFYDDVGGAAGAGSPTLVVANALSVEVESVYNGTTASLVEGSYDKGVFENADLIKKDKAHDDINDVYGDLCWLAYRKDVIESIGDITTNTGSGTAIVIDSKHSKIDSVGHGLVDGDHIDIGGTVYLVDEADADTFVIFTDATPVSGAVTFYWATVTTAETEVGDDGGVPGLVTESANHNFEDGMTVHINGTVNYDGAYILKYKTDTTFNIAVDSAYGSESVGTAVLNTIHVRSESGVDKVIQGEIRYIGHSDTKNIMNFIGQTEPSDTKPEYLFPSDYTGKLGMANYGDTNESDNLTNRVSRLTGMMADKAQDKTICKAPSGIVSVQNDGFGNITFNGTAQNLKLLTPTSLVSGVIDMTGAFTIGVNQCIYFRINRNSDVVNYPIVPEAAIDINEVPLEENVFILLYRLSEPTVYLWDGTEIPIGITPYPATGAGDAGVLEPFDLSNVPFKATFEDTFEDTDRVDNIKTTATIDSVSKIATIKYDNTGLGGNLSNFVQDMAGTNITFTNVGSYVIAEGDIIVAEFISGKESREIVTVNAQDDVVISTPFTADITTAINILISQVVHSLDLNNSIFNDIDPSAKYVSEVLSSVLLGTPALGIYPFSNYPDWTYPAIGDIVIQEVGGVDEETTIFDIPVAGQMELSVPGGIVAGPARVITPLEKFMVGYHDDGGVENINVACQVITCQDILGFWDAEPIIERPANYSDELPEHEIQGVLGGHLYVRLFANRFDGAGEATLYDYCTAWYREDEYYGNYDFQAAGKTSEASGYRCAIDVDGGLTRLTFSGFSYIPFLNPNSSNGHLEVYLNGNKIPRYINPTLTVGAYYTEVGAGNAIYLDRDYTLDAYFVEVKFYQRVNQAPISENFTKIGSIYGQSTDFDMPGNIGEKHKCQNIVIKEVGGIGGVTLDIGTTPGGSEIMAGYVVGAGELKNIDVGTIFSDTIGTTIYVTSGSWGTAIIDCHVSSVQIMN